MESARIQQIGELWEKVSGERYGNGCISLSSYSQSDHDEDGNFNSLSQQDMFFIGREGIFIQTLIPPGHWQVSCSKPGYEPITLENMEIEKGHHCKQDLVLKPSVEENSEN